jgi:hypothetical protein
MNLGIVLRAKNTVSLLILGQEQMIYVLIIQHRATWRGTAQRHHGAGHAARGIVQTGILIFEKGKIHSGAQIVVETIRSPMGAAWHGL